MSFFRIMVHQRHTKQASSVRDIELMLVGEVGHFVWVGLKIVELRFVDERIS
jgi:hypothetical protein